MSSIRSLRILLGTTPVGSLFALDDGRVYFRFDDEYANDANRPVLSQIYKASTEQKTKAQLGDPALGVNRGNGKGGLPPFFQNLLPEGQLRKHLQERGNLRPDDEFGLLAYCGKSLPGNVYALAETLDEKEIGRLLGQSRDSYEMSSYQTPTPEGESLSGVQPKVALVRERGGRYVMRSKDNGGAHFIGKLPAGDYALLPEVEHASLVLAEYAGIKVCKHEVLPLNAIAERLPFSLRDEAENFLLVHRFDRDAPTENGRLHIEDFAQATGVAPDEKYQGTYAAIGQVLLERSMHGEDDVYELLRRIKVNELLGNFDAHLKNFSLLYSTPQDVALSPAYDIVAYSAYIAGNGHALAFTPDQRNRQLLTPQTVRALANLWGLPEPKLAAAIADTVDKAMRSWPDLLPALPLTNNQRENILRHLEENASVIAWRKRDARKNKRTP